MARPHPPRKENSIFILNIWGIGRDYRNLLLMAGELLNSVNNVPVYKRGKPIAEIIPVSGPGERISLKDTVTFMGDIISPVAVEDWEDLLLDTHVWIWISIDDRRSLSRKARTNVPYYPLFT